MKHSPLEIQTPTQKLIYFFLDYPEKQFGLNELVKTLKISKTTANKTIKSLEKIGFLNVEVFGNIWRVSLNQTHELNKSKLPYHLQLIQESNILKNIHKAYPNPKAVVLFGSYRKGDDVSTSDIDIAIELTNNTPLEIKELGFSKKLGYRRNVRINLTIFSRDHIKNNLFTNIANGIVLEGLLEMNLENKKTW